MSEPDEAIDRTTDQRGAEVMDERRDLVDRKKLRRQIEGASGFTHGWTRDEVLAELDADPDAVCEYLNLVWNDWRPMDRNVVKDWQDPDVPRPNVRVVRVAPEPEWVPLTQLVGRTIDGEIKTVTGWSLTHCDAMWFAEDGHSYRFPEGTLNLGTGQVAVRPKAAM